MERALQSQLGMSLSLQLLFKTERRSARSTGEKVHNGSELIIFSFPSFPCILISEQKDEEAVIYSILIYGFLDMKMIHCILGFSI